MSFKSLDGILGNLQSQPEWQLPLNSFQCLLKCWPEVAGKQVSLHARPISIQKDTLWVATSSSVWAQNLTFQRQLLLKKLNPYLPSPLTDIRFSTAKWQEKNAPSTVTADSWQSHPSRIVTPSAQISASARSPNPELSPPKLNPQQAFQNWEKMLQVRAQSLPLCAECQCPTPPGEIARWSVCALCAAKRWQL